MTSSPADARVARARALVGTRFVPHGRDPDRGLDCVGLIASALDLPTTVPDYPLRCGRRDLLAAGLRAAGLLPADPPLPGDVLALNAGPGQLHVGLWTGGSLIHADAGLRRVVERPAPLAWPLLGAWRPADKEVSTRRSEAWRR